MSNTVFFFNILLFFFFFLPVCIITSDVWDHVTSSCQVKMYDYVETEEEMEVKNYVLNKNNKEKNMTNSFDRQAM